MIREIKGVVPILATAFYDDGSLDIESTQRLLELMIKLGIDGIALFGNASETKALNLNEKQQIFSMVNKIINGKLPVVAGVGGATAEEVIENARFIEQFNPDALMIMPGTSTESDPDKVYNYFFTISNAVRTPIMLQDAPIASGVMIPEDTIVKLVNDCKNIIYVKEEMPPTVVKIKHIINKLGDKVNVFCGLNGTYYYEELLSGVRGVMPAAEFPDAFLKIQAAFNDGRKDEARQLFCEYLPYIRMGTMQGGYAMAIHKTVLKLTHIFTSAKVRQPNLQLDDSLTEIVLDCLKHTDLWWKEFI